MNHQMLFYFVFFCQILVVSLLLPFTIVGRMKTILANHPRDQYPKLYPISPEKIHNASSYYFRMNVVVMLVGFGLAFHGLYYETKEMMNWDNTSVLTLYFLLQMLPLMLADVAGFKYCRLMREADQRSTRKISLRPRRLFDFVSPALVATAVLIYLAATVLVVYVAQNPFPGFAGYANIFFITGLNLFFSGMIVWQIRGKKRNPYQTEEDHFRQISIGVRLNVLVSILATLFLMIVFILPGLGLRQFTDVIMMVYFVLCAFAGCRTYATGAGNFEAYKAGSGDMEPKNKATALS